MLTLGASSCLLAAARRPASLPIHCSLATDRVVAMDLDVLVDAAPEATRLAWTTASRLWPVLMEECASVERVMDDSAYAERRRLGGKPLIGRTDDGVPQWFEAKMRLLFPLVNEDYESLVLARLCAEEVSSSDVRKRPLTVGEIVANWTPELCELLLARYGLEQSEAARHCATTREEWLADDSDDGPRAVPYKAARALTRNALVGSTEGDGSQPIVYILTARQVPHAQALLRWQGIELAAERVIGGLSPEGKLEALVSLRQRHPSGTLRFVDDDPDTLRRVAADPRLFSAQLFFAAWGHSKVDGEATVASMPRVLSLEESPRLEEVLQ